MNPKVTAAIFAVIVATAGWFYMFYSRAAQKLSEVEGSKANNRRVRLRRANGLAMFLLAVCIFAGAWTFSPEKAPGPWMLVWLAAIVLVFVILVLGMLDVRLTARLRRAARPESPRTPL
jgi:UDP-N-acetylmuramyl pentapeptide phosphotransferase/UDP-N-acetylglucosamine-1-phosphate transferase